MATDDTRGREAIAGGGGQGVIAAADGHGWPRMKPAGVRRSREAAGDGGGGGGTGIFFNND
ncbi:MAG: hypothetical protein ACK5FF_12125 [Planctomyces sp.]